MDPTKEHSLPPNPIEQKVKDAFADYPSTTQRGITSVLEMQRKAWQRLRSNPGDMITGVVVSEGLAYQTSITSVEIPKRELSPEEKLAYTKFQELIEPYKRTKVYGFPSGDEPNTRFYLSLKDGLQSVGLMTDLTTKLLDLHKQGKLPFFMYKFDSTDEEGTIRFDPQYRDKGASPILYVPNADVEITNQILEELSNQYPEAFLPQDAPFKYPSHGQINEGWHISMEASDLSEQFKTPEQGMRKASSDFLMSLGLTKEWIPVQSLDAMNLRKSWEKSVLKVHRQPQTPWITLNSGLIPPILTNSS